MVQLTEIEALCCAELLSRNTVHAARRADPQYNDPVSDDKDKGEPLAGANPAEDPAPGSDETTLLSCIGFP